jgi:hypothetical protein
VSEDGVGIAMTTARRPPAVAARSHQLSIEDDVKLTWYFGEGMTYFQRSTFGPMLEHAQLFGFSGQYGAAVNAVPISTAYPKAGWPEVVDGEIEYSDREITAQPISETVSPGGNDPPSWAAERMAYVTRRLAQLPELHRDALAALYGREGDRCAAEAGKGGGFGLSKVGGRAVAVYPFTPTGRQLIAASEAETRRNGAALHMVALERIAVIVTQAEAHKTKQPDRWEKVLRAAREADALIAAASEAWNRVSAALPKRRGEK